MYIETTKLKDSTGNLIDPATDGEVSFFRRMLLQYFSSPMGYDKSIGRNRVTAVLESGTVTTVTTVGSVTTVANIALLGGAQPQLLTNGQNMSAWQASVRSRIT